MRSLIFIFMCLAWGNALLQAQESRNFEIPSKKTLQTWLTESKVPAVAIATFASGVPDQYIVAGELAPEVPAPADAMFNVASLTKSISTYLALILVSNGDWHLDEPLYHYWVDPDVKDDPQHKKLTTRHVLSHRTGFVNWRWMHETKKLTFDHAPGSQLGYSGEGFEYMRKAMEKKFNMTFDQLVDSLVFAPLGMGDSHMIWRDQLDTARLALPHQETGTLHEVYRRKEAVASDDLMISLQDMTTFGKALIAQKSISEKLYNEMIHPYSEMKPGTEMGLSWIIFPKVGEKEEYALFNAGSDPGTNAIMAFFPESQRGLIIMTNGDHGRDIIMKVVATTIAEGPELLQRLGG
ncbi:MAG: serine hydrolase domain-containing protein [Bacteroidota bacterium]